MSFNTGVRHNLPVPRDSDPDLLEGSLLAEAERPALRCGCPAARGRSEPHLRIAPEAGRVPTDLPVNRVLQSHISTSEHLQGHGLHHLPGQPVPKW